MTAREYLDSPCVETDESRRERFRALAGYIIDEYQYILAALAADDVARVRHHFEEVEGWAGAAIDEAVGFVEDEERGGPQ